MNNNFTSTHKPDHTGIKEFVQKFEVSDLYDNERWTTDDINDVEHYILHEICKHCENGFFVDFDFENITMTDIDMGGLYGFQTLPNGMEILGLFIGGDWEIPVNVILYLKNGKLYNYIPKFGNCYNHETNKAYLNENVDDPHFCFINFNYDKDKMIEEILSKF